MTFQGLVFTLNKLIFSRCKESTVQKKKKKRKLGTFSKFNTQGFPTQESAG